jgi:lipocalin
MSAGEGDRAIFDVGFDSFYVVLPDGQRMDLPFGRSLNPGHTDKRNYWIHWLAPDFSLAIVGSPTSFLRDGTLKGNVWVLSRTRQVSQKRMSEIASLIKQIGYDPETVEATPETIMKMSS